MNQVSFMFVTFAAVFALAIPATAQDDGEMGFGDIEEPAPGEEAAQDNEEENEEDTFLAGEQTEEEKLLAAPTEEADTGLHEDPETKYFSVGLRLRWVMIPEWFLGMFGVDIQTNDGRHLLINNVGIGPEFTYRKDGFDIAAASWYMRNMATANTTLNAPIAAHNSATVLYRASVFLRTYHALSRFASMGSPPR